MPVAVKLVVSPFATEAVAGLMAIAVNTGAVTVNAALLEVMPFAEAVMVLLPCASEEAMPLAFSVATVVSLDIQVTDPEILPELPSEYVPVAVNVTGVPLGVEDVAGPMLIPVTTAAVTVNGAADEETPFNEAVTVVLPTATPVATPVVLLIVVMALSAAAQATLLVMSVVVLSVYVPVAVKLVVSPLATVAVAGVMAMLVSVTGVGVALPLPPPQPESISVVTTSMFTPNSLVEMFNSFFKKFISNSLIASIFQGFKRLNRTIRMQ